MAASKSVWNLRRLTILLMFALAASVVFQNGKASHADGSDALANLAPERIATEFNSLGPSEPILKTDQKSTVNGEIQ